MTPTTIEATPINYAVVGTALAEYEHARLLDHLAAVGAWLQAAEADRKAAEEAAAAAAAAAAAERKAQQQRQQQQQPVYSTSGGGGLNSFLLCVRQRESGGDYSARNPSSSAAGAFQMLLSTSNIVAGWIGRPDLVGVPASEWPPSVQDQGAIELLNRMGTSPWASTRAPC